MPISSGVIHPRLIQPDHYHLDGEDKCYFIAEYTAGRGYSHSATNQFIYNLKKGMERQGLPDWPYKDRAIRQAAFALQDLGAGAAAGGNRFEQRPAQETLQPAGDSGASGKPTSR